MEIDFSEMGQWSNTS